MMMNDKMKHMVAGMVAAFVVALPCYLSSNDLFVGLWASVVTALLVGAVKEWCDNNTPGNAWNWIELLMTVVGGVVVALVIVLLHFGKG